MGVFACSLSNLSVRYPCGSVRISAPVYVAMNRKGLEIMNMRYGRPFIKGHNLVEAENSFAMLPKVGAGRANLGLWGATRFGVGRGKTKRRHGNSPLGSRF